MSCFLYVLYSKSLDKYYIGSTEDLPDRLSRHNSGRSQHTKRGAPWELAYCEEYDTRSEAVRRKRDLKAWKDRSMIEHLVRMSRS
jgi:putative endonuclease